MENKTISDFLTTISNYRHNNSEELTIKDLVNWGKYTVMSNKSPCMNSITEKNYVLDNYFSDNKHKILVNNDMDKATQLDPLFILKLPTLKGKMMNPLDITKTEVLCQNQKHKNMMLAELADLENGFYLSEYNSMVNNDNENDKIMITYFYKNPKLLNLIGHIGYFLLNFETTEIVKVTLLKRLIKKLDSDILEYIPFSNQKNLFDILNNYEIDQLIIGYSLLKIYINCWHVMYSTKYGKDVINDINQKIGQSEKIRLIEKQIICVNGNCSQLSGKEKTCEKLDESIGDQKSILDTKLKHKVKAVKRLESVEDNVEDNDDERILLPFVQKVESSNDKNLYLLFFCIDSMVIDEINQVIEISEQDEPENMLIDLIQSNDIINSIKEKNHSVCLFFPDQNNEKFFLTSYVFKQIDNNINILNNLVGIDVASEAPDLANYIKSLPIIDNIIGSLINNIKMIKQILHIK